MIILAIETSCDETAAAVVKNGSQILSSAVASSEALHRKYGGIFPEQAAREQIKSIIPVIEETIENCPGETEDSRRSRNKLKIENLTALAVTIGPGLIGSLLVGVETAKTLAYLWQRPIVPVNHLAGHIYANWLGTKETKNIKPPQFPLIALIVSGGHTELVYMKKHGEYQLLGATRDDAAGECFDKCARFLELGYPGGPAIEQAASTLTSSSLTSKLNIKTIKLPRPMINSKDFDFSFSGLKTAVINLVNQEKISKKKLVKLRPLIAYEIQEAIVDVLIHKVITAADKYTPRSIVIGGGVAANKRLRSRLKSAVSGLSSRPRLHIPPVPFCTDSAAPIAAAAYFNYRPVAWQKIQVNPGLELAV